MNLNTDLSFNNGEGSEGTTSMDFVHLGGTFKQTRVQVEDVTGVGFATWGTTQQQRHLTVGNGLFRQIVEDDQSVLAVVAEEFTHGASGVGGQELQRGGIRGGGSHDDRVFHGIGVSQTFDDLGHSRTFLSDSDVDAEQLLLLVSTVVEALLVDDGINSNGGFAVSNKHKKLRIDLLVSINIITAGQ